ncbi:MAG: hypothetical protein CMJ47_09410 [Planctomyces sp.]|nr:hypothetical protein [Planctomyces sp.]
MYSTERFFLLPETSDRGIEDTICVLTFQKKRGKQGHVKSHAAREQRIRNRAQMRCEQATAQ